MGLNVEKKHFYFILNISSIQYNLGQYVMKSIFGVFVTFLLKYAKSIFFFGPFTI